MRQRHQAVVDLNGTLNFEVLSARDVVEMAGFTVTTPVRSLIDVAATASDEEQLARAIQDAFSRSMTTPKQLRSRSETIDMRAALLIERALVMLENT